MRVTVRDLGRRPWAEVFDAMQRFTEERGDDTADEIWSVEHEPVYTLGRSGDPAHILDAGDVPVERTDRGGQVTWHGPGQLVVYVLIDLARRGWGVKRLVGAIEQSIIDLCAGHGIEAARRPGAPGVYVDGRKLAALGLRVRKGRTYHGLALNVDADLAAFSRINPCGYPGLEVTQLRALGVALSLAEVREALLGHLLRNLEYTAQS